MEVIRVYSKFENLAQEKKERIIQASLAEFAQYGYQNASTNRIVKKAGISKGLLFHYFESKKNLYLYILDQVTAKYMAELFGKTDQLSGDIFQRMMEIGLLKIELAQKFPARHKLLVDAFVHSPPELEEDLSERYKKIYQSSMPRLLADLDTSRFREDIDRTKALELILYALEGVSNRYLKTFKDMPYEKIMGEMDRLIKDYEQYIDILKYGVYR